MPAGALIANRYEVLGSLGAGGGGDVYRVQDHNEGDTVALKIINPRTVTPLGVWSEAQMLRQLSDNHILAIRNAFSHLGYDMIVTEIAANGSVDDLVEAQPLGLDVTTAIRWSRQASLGLARAHDHGLLHNDIKPGNLFLTQNQDCQLGDFGFAGHIDPATGFAPVYGASFQTVAPEVANAWTSAPKATIASDIYSMAATSYWMLAGRPVHDLAGLTVPEQIAHISTTPAPRLRDVAPHVPETIARVIDQALALDPAARRPLTAHEFSAALGRSITGRRWVRTDEHSTALNHLSCWRGIPARSGSVLVLCMTPGRRASQRILTTAHATSGKRVAKGCATATKSTWPVVVRRLMAALS